jgi:uncharacterized membrane protein YkvA (DUF1232 family)
MLSGKSSGKLKETAREIRDGARHAPWYVKLLIAAGLLYLLSPIDLIPDFIPVLGQLDDVILITGLLRLVRKYALDKTD